MLDSPRGDAANCHGAAAAPFGDEAIPDRFAAEIREGGSEAYFRPGREARRPLK
jgi:hypothetical protein